MNGAPRVLLISDEAAMDPKLVADLRVLTGAPAPKLIGLFIRDPLVLQAMSITQVKYVTHSGDIAGVSAAEFVTAMDDTARQQAQSLLTAARNQGYEAEFTVVEGNLETLLERYGPDSALIVVTRPDLPGQLRSRPAAEVMHALPAGQPVLFVNAPWSSGQAVVVHCPDESREQAAPALQLAARYAQAAGLSLDIALAPTAALPQFAFPENLRLHRGQWTDGSIAQLCALVDARLLILTGADDGEQTAVLDGFVDSVLARLCDQLSCSILRLPSKARE